ncbi:ATP-binding protein [Pyxidicoccus sp. 3LFB2]
MLLELAAAKAPDFQASLRQILKSDAEQLGVARVSYWSLSPDDDAIHCDVLYLRDTDTFDGGTRLRKQDCPRYFQALLDELYIDAADACQDSRTREFSESYLRPLGISSMLDVPVWVRGRLGGVVCHEHIGAPRPWTVEEQAFARSIGHVVSMALETAERRRTEESLRQSEERFRLLVDGVRDQALIMLDPEGHVMSWNAGAQRILGYETAEALGRHFSTFHPTDSVTRGRPQAQLLAAVEQGQVEVEGWRLRKDGSRFWARVVLTSLRDAEGRLRGFAEVSRGFDERRRAEQQQRLLVEASAAAQRQRLLAEASAALVSSLDPEAALTAVAHRAVPLLGDMCLMHLQEDGVIRRVACEHAPGSRVEALCGPTLGPEESGTPLPVLTRVLRTGRSRFLPDTAKLLRRLDAGDSGRVRFPLLQRLRPASLLVVPLIARGRTLGALTLLRDAPGHPYHREDLVLAEELARRTAYAVDNSRLYQEAQQAISLRDEFLSIASHELRTPITTLHLQIQHLQRLCSKTQEVTLCQKLEVSTKQIHRLDKLIDGLLDVSRISTGQLRFSLEELDLSQLASEVMEHFQVEAARAQCELVLRTSGPVTGRYDRLRLEQVLANLLSNAIKYASGRPVTVGVEGTGDVARLTVQDQGIGIPEKDVSRIFGRFERAVSPRNYGGLGLGLYITRQIVEAHGGAIDVKSRPGEGSTFTVTLPRRFMADPVAMGQGASEA